MVPVKQTRRLAAAIISVRRTKLASTRYIIQKVPNRCNSTILNAAWLHIKVCHDVTYQKNMHAAPTFVVVWFSILPHGYLRRGTRITSDPTLINISTWITWTGFGFDISMAQCKTAATPLLMHWSYCSLALSHQHTLVKSKQNYMYLMGSTVNMPRYQCLVSKLYCRIITYMH